MVHTHTHFVGDIPIISIDYSTVPPKMVGLIHMFFPMTSSAKSPIAYIITRPFSLLKSNVLLGWVSVLPMKSSLYVAQSFCLMKSNVWMLRIPSVVGEIHLFSAISPFLVGDIWNPPSFRHKNGDPLLLLFRLCLSSLGLQQLGNLIKIFLTKRGKRSEYVWGSFDVWLLRCQAMDTSGSQWDDSYIIIGYKMELYVLWFFDLLWVHFDL